MHTIKLNVGDSVYTHLMFLLKNLKTNELEIIEDKRYDQTVNNHEIDFAKFKVKSFESIKDPVRWQQNIRDEWDR